MAAADATAAPPETPLPAPHGRGNDDASPSAAAREKLCCICHLPAQPVRPLPPLRGSSQPLFIHPGCQIWWETSRQRSSCEVCKLKDLRLSVWEFMAGLPGKLMSLLLPLLFAACVVYETIINLITLHTWHLVFASTFAQVHHLISLRLSATCIIASVSSFAAFANTFAPFAVAPFARWVKRLKTRRWGWWGIDGWQVLALFTVEACLVVLIAEMVIACIFGLLPFSIGRVMLWCMSCCNFGNVDEVDSYTSTTSTILVGYGVIFSMGVFFVGLNTFRQYLTGKRLMIAIIVRSVSGIFLRGVRIFFRRLPGRILRLIIVANIGVNLLYTFILHPLFIGLLLDICTSKMFGVTMSQRLKLLIASSFSSTILHWFTGRTILSLRLRVFIFLRKVLKPGIMIHFVEHNVREPFFTFYFKRLPCIFDDITFIALVILVPTKIAVQLAPEVFPVNITYFDRPAIGTSFWQGSRYYAESLSGVLYLKFLIANTILYLEWLVWRVRSLWFFTAGEALWNIVSPREHYDATDEVNNRKRFVVVQTMPQLVLSWLAVLIFSSVTLIFSISIGRTLLFAVPELPVAGQMKSNDLFAIAVGSGVISIIIAASRDAFVRKYFGETSLVALEVHLILFIWIFFIPLLIGWVIDLSLLSPFIGPDNDVPVLDFFCTWSLGRLTQICGTKLARRYKVGGDLPFLADSIDNYSSGDKLEGLSKMRPFVTKLLGALLVPYVLAKGIFPRLGYSAAVNSTAYRFAWLGSIALYAVCYLAKVTCTMLHDSIRDDRYGPSIHTDSVCDHEIANFLDVIYLDKF